MLVDPEQDEAECATYPTVDICEGAVKVGVSVPTVTTVKAPTEEGEAGQSYLIVPEPAVGFPLTTRLPLQALLVVAAWADMVTTGKVRVRDVATAAPTNTTPIMITRSGLM